MSILRSIALHEIKSLNVEPTTDIENIRKISERVWKLGKKLELIYDHVSFLSGGEAAEMAKGKVKNIYSYILGKLASKRERDRKDVARWLHHLAEHLEDYKEVMYLHGTNSNRLERILREGIAPSSESGHVFEPIPWAKNTPHRKSIHLILVPNSYTAPSASYLARYAHFPELIGEKGGFPVIVGGKHLDINKVLRFYPSGAEVILDRVPPQHITHVFVPEKYLEEAKRIVGKRAKVLPMEPLFISLILANYGFNIWDKEPNPKVLLKKLFEDATHIEVNENDIRIRLKGQTYAYPQAKYKILDKSALKRLAEHHLKEDVEIVGEGFIPFVIYKNGWPEAKYNYHYAGIEEEELTERIRKELYHILYSK